LSYKFTAQAMTELSVLTENLSDFEQTN